jgi:hypothetical protein
MFEKTSRNAANKGTSRRWRILWLVPAFAMSSLMLVASLASATTLTTWNSAWNGTGSSWNPCNGPSNGVTTEVATASTGGYDGFSQSTSTSSSGCTSNTAQYLQFAGLHSANTFSVASTGTYSITVHMTMNYYWSVSNYCHSGYASQARMWVYLAVWDNTAGVNVYGNVLAPVFAEDSLNYACSGGYQGASSVVTNSAWSYTFTGVSLTGGNSNIPRVGLQEETNSMANYQIFWPTGYSSYGMVDFTGYWGPVTLNSIVTP